jgi:hypothetical protein
MRPADDIRWRQLELVNALFACGSERLTYDLRALSEPDRQVYTRGP